MPAVSRFKWRFLTSAIAAIGVAIIPTAASASIDAPLPTDLYITFNGLDWAWASPCSPSGCIGAADALDLSFQGADGWRLALASDFNNGPTAADFGSSGDFKCATAYFSDYWTHCDYSDATSGYVWNMPGGTSLWASESWVVRASDAPAVPEPATWAMMLLGFGAVGFSMRRKREGMLQQIA